MVCHLDEDAVEMLIRLGGLLLKHSKDSDKAGWTVAARTEFLDLSHRLLGIASRIEESLQTDGVAPGVGEDVPRSARSASPVLELKVPARASSGTW